MSRSCLVLFFPSVVASMLAAGCSTGLEPDGFADFTAEAAKATPKVDICHQAGSGSYHIISVAASAVSAHLDHGDWLVTPEVCDAVDNDCDGTVDEGVEIDFFADADGDGFGDAASTTAACEAPSGFVADATDCDDAEGAINPSAAEICDGIDNECDGVVDDGLDPLPADNTLGECAGNVLVCAGVMGWQDSTDNYPPVDETCDELDNDCDGTVDEGVQGTFYGDMDGDGYGSADLPTLACSEPAGYASNPDDCDDGNDVVNPGAAESCDELDNDCDGVVDEGVQLTFFADMDGDGFGAPGMTSQACSAPADYVADGTDCDDFTNATHPGAAESCDEVDNDCDGAVDEGVQGTFYGDMDGDGYGSADLPTLACSEPAGYASNPDDCDDGSDVVNPGAAETCDELDNDCDGSVDEGVQSTWYGDMDGDGYGGFDIIIQACSEPAGCSAYGTDCDDANDLINPAAAESCDGMDNDCDGLVDDGIAPIPADLTLGECADNELVCSGGSWLASSDNWTPIDEFCGDGYDDDCDGTVDNGCVTDPAWVTVSPDFRPNVYQSELLWFDGAPVVVSLAAWSGPETMGTLAVQSWDGGSWQTIETGLTQQYAYSFSAKVDDGLLYLSGADGLIQVYDGFSWTELPDYTSYSEVPYGSSGSTIAFDDDGDLYVAFHYYTGVGYNHRVAVKVYDDTPGSEGWTEVGYSGSDGLGVWSYGGYGFLELAVSGGTPYLFFTEQPSEVGIHAWDAGWSTSVANVVLEYTGTAWDYVGSFGEIPSSVYNNHIAVLDDTLVVTNRSDYAWCNTPADGWYACSDSAGAGDNAPLAAYGSSLYSFFYGSEGQSLGEFDGESWTDVGPAIADYSGTQLAIADDGTPWAISASGWPYTLSLMVADYGDEEVEEPLVAEPLVPVAGAYSSHTYGEWTDAADPGQFPWFSGISTGNDEWLEYDYGTPVRVMGVQAYVVNGRQGCNARVQGSNDEVVWTDLHSWDWTLQDYDVPWAGWTTYNATFEASDPYRYVRMFSDPCPYLYYSWLEFQGAM
jgi:hypothetical protein